MKVEKAVYPSPEKFLALASDEAPGPITMVNLLKFRDKAVYKDGRTDNVSGVEAYMRYGAEMRKIVESAGGRLIFSGRVEGILIGDVEDL
jgi:hypothetical protein